ncbi:hypothetical protein H5410_014995 [Solanum commersonii]|uniref:Uncharacterized protein n=1 Tax=Solanum commersonii TaxID=4109 RepID=A0A9J5ZSU3_SOLCO|nr:hypothetical protein H5410_014995 [Solanum commersonii]
MSKEKSKYRPPIEQGGSMDIENKHIEDKLLTILQKLNEQDRVLEKIRENVEVLNQMSGSHSRSIQLIETLLGHVMSHLHQAQGKGIGHEMFVKKCRMNYTSPTGELPTRSTTATKTTVWILTLTEGPIKLSEIDEHSADRRVAKKIKLMSPNG